MLLPPVTGAVTSTTLRTQPARNVTDAAVHSFFLFLEDAGHRIGKPHRGMAFPSLAPMVRGRLVTVKRGGVGLDDRAGAMQARRMRPRIGVLALGECWDAVGYAQ
jgi:hypothetical protein